MADDTKQGIEIDWPTAEVHAGNLIKGFKGFEHALDILRTANSARHWMEANTQEIAGRNAEIAKLKKETEAASQAAVTAKRMQTAAEENARQAEAAAKKAEDTAGAQTRSAENQQTGRLKMLADEFEGHRRRLESDHNQHKAELDEIIGAKQAELSELAANIEALRAGLPRAK